MTVTESIVLTQNDPATVARNATDLLTMAANAITFEGHQLGKPVVITGSVFSVEGDVLTFRIDFRASDGAKEQLFIEHPDGTVEQARFGG